MKENPKEVSNESIQKEVESINKPIDFRSLNEIGYRYIAAEFTYNGSIVTARRTGNYMKTEKISGILVSVHGEKSAVQKPSKSRRIAFQEGTTTLGFTYKGNDL